VKSAAGRNDDLRIAQRLAARPLWIEGLGSTSANIPNNIAQERADK